MQCVGVPTHYSRDRHNGLVVDETPEAARAEFGDDAALVAALRDGDEAAFAWLINRYSPSLRRLALTYVPTPAVADEVVQETWLGVVTGIGRFEERSTVKTWVYRILVNIARSKGARERRTVPFASVGPEVEDDEPAVSPDRFQGNRDRFPGQWAAPPVPWDEKPEERLVSAETLAVVEAAIAQLPINQKTVITMRDLDGFRADEVCNALEISETNQRVLLHRARSKVRQALESHFEEVTL